MSEPRWIGGRYQCTVVPVKERQMSKRHDNVYTANETIKAGDPLTYKTRRAWPKFWKREISGVLSVDAQDCTTVPIGIALQDSEAGEPALMVIQGMISLPHESVTVKRTRWQRFVRWVKRILH